MSHKEIPHTFKDCGPGGVAHQRPCPWATCRYHLLTTHEAAHRALVVWAEDRKPGSPDSVSTTNLSPEESAQWADELARRIASMPETCALDIARRAAFDGLSAQQAGEQLGIGPWAARKAEARGLVQLRRAAR